MMRVGPTFGTRGKSWDHQGKSEISQIFISCSPDRIHYMYFAYVEDGTNVVLSDKIGGVEGSSTSLKTITLDYPSEYITEVSGCYVGVVDLDEDWDPEEGFTPSRRYLGSITFHTNKGKYGPYTPTSETIAMKPNFNYEVGGKFNGFYGTYTSDGIETIGFYMKPLQINRILPDSAYSTYITSLQIQNSPPALEFEI